MSRLRESQFKTNPHRPSRLRFHLWIGGVIAAGVMGSVASEAGAAPPPPNSAQQSAPRSSVKIGNAIYRREVGAKTPVTEARYYPYGYGLYRPWLYRPAYYPYGFGYRPYYGGWGYPYANLYNAGWGGYYGAGYWGGPYYSSFYSGWPNYYYGAGYGGGWPYYSMGGFYGGGGWPYYNYGVGYAPYGGFGYGGMGYGYGGMGYGYGGCYYW